MLWDERLSTVAAENVLIDADMKRKKRRKIIDMMAAVVICRIIWTAGAKQTAAG